MVLGRLVHYAVDAVLVSTVIAGLKRASGFEPQTSLITEPTLRNAAESYLGIGEKVFNVAQATAVNSSYWKREGPKGR